MSSSSPETFPEPWASDWGEDEHGLWMGFTLGDVRQGFRWIQPGTFMMGSPADEAERQTSEKQHRVTLTRGFWLAETVCTQALYYEVLAENSSTFRGMELPVQWVSWNDTRKFLTGLKERIPSLNPNLPTEAQWEYACRAGTNTPFSFGHNVSPSQVNYCVDRPYAEEHETDPYHPSNLTELPDDDNEFPDQPIPVMKPPAGKSGLYHMHGNVMEWCVDWYGDYPDGPIIDPTGPVSGSGRVLRGGNWSSAAGSCRSASRTASRPGARMVDCSFRMVHNPSNTTMGTGHN